MKLTDDEIIAALLGGKRIRRESSNLPLNYFNDGGLLSKETDDGRPRRVCRATLTVDDIIADDWRVAK